MTLDFIRATYNTSNSIVVQPPLILLHGSRVAKEQSSTNIVNQTYE